MRTLSIKISGIAAGATLLAFTASMAVRRSPGALRLSKPAEAVEPVSFAASVPAAERADRAQGALMAQATARPSAAPAAPSNAAAFWSSQKLIRSGDLRILVKDVRRAIAIADSVAQLHGALLADSRASADAQTTQVAQLQFRVPADRFAETVAALRTIGDVRGESINTQDVTKDYADLDTRVRVKDETVTRLRSLLATHTAKLGDVLQVEQELARVVTELEQLKGERHYYDRQIAMSTLSISLFEQQVVPPPARFTDPVLAAARRALEVLGTSLAGVVYGVVFILPWLVLGTIFWWVFTLVRPRITLPAAPIIPRRQE